MCLGDNPLAEPAPAQTNACANGLAACHRSGQKLVPAPCSSIPMKPITSGCDDYRTASGKATRGIAFGPWRDLQPPPHSSLAFNSPPAAEFSRLSAQDVLSASQWNGDRLAKRLLLPKIVALGALHD